MFSQSITFNIALEKNLNSTSVVQRLRNNGFNL